MKSKCDAVRPLLGGAVLLACCAVAADVVVENDDFRLAVGDDACVRSLVVKATGEECVDASLKAPLLSVTQDRPFDNELKLIHPNKRIVYPANSLRRVSWSRTIWTTRAGLLVRAEPRPWRPRSMSPIPMMATCAP